jgi:hypothetical protein
MTVLPVPGSNRVVNGAAFRARNSNPCEPRAARNIRSGGR